MSLRENIQNASEFDELFGGSEITVLTKNITLKSGANYKRGMLLTETGGKCELTGAGAVADYVLARDVDATKADAIGTVYVCGRFNREKIIVADGDNAANHEAELRTKNIYFTVLL